MAGAGADDHHDHHDDPFAALLDRARGAEEVAARSRARWIRRQAEESASLLGTLMDLAEAGTPVVVRTGSGRRHQGRVTAVGADFVVLALTSGRATALAIPGMAWVRPQGAGEQPIGPATGDRPPALDVRLVELLADAAHDRPRVLLAVLGDPDPLVGELRAVGVDVVTLAGDGGARAGAVHYVPVGSLTEVAFTSG